MFGLNATQWQRIYQALLAASGPIASAIALFFKTDAVETKAKIDVVLVIISLLTPALAGIWATATSTNKDQLAAVAAMPPAQATAAVAEMPTQALSNIAVALSDRATAITLSDKAVVTAAGALEGVEVKVDKSASRGAMAAALDPSVPSVNPA